MINIKKIYLLLFITCLFAHRTEAQSITKDITEKFYTGYAGSKRGAPEEAWDLYDTGRYNLAFNKLLPHAENSDRESMFRLAMLYKLGAGTYKDIKKAVYWFERAANFSHLEAQHNLVYLYSEKGNGVTNFFRARVWAEAIVETTKDKEMKDFLTETEDYVSKEDKIKAATIANKWVKKVRLTLLPGAGEEKRTNNF